MKNLNMYKKYKYFNDLNEIINLKYNAKTNYTNVKRKLLNAFKL